MDEKCRPVLINPVKYLENSCGIMHSKFTRNGEKGKKMDFQVFDNL